MHADCGRGDGLARDGTGVLWCNPCATRVPHSHLALNLAFRVDDGTACVPMHVGPGAAVPLLGLAPADAAALDARAQRERVAALIGTTHTLAITALADGTSDLCTYRIDAIAAEHAGASCRTLVSLLTVSV